MAPNKKKTPKGKKGKQQLATSFKKQKLTPAGSAKKFKRTRSAKRKQNLSSASAFNASALSPSKASTPLVKHVRPKRSNNVIDKVFKGNRIVEASTHDSNVKDAFATPSTSAMENTTSSVESPYPAFPTPVASVEQKVKFENDTARRGQDDSQEARGQVSAKKATLQDLARKECPRGKRRGRGGAGAGPPQGRVLKGDLGDMFR